MNDEVKKLFDKAATDYDTQRRGLIPCYDDFYEAVIRWLQLPSASPSILDLGAGTGLLTSYVLQKYPSAAMTLIDFSQDMLAKAEQRLASFSNINYIASDYLSYRFDTKFDAVVSSLSIHHLTDQEKKQLFFSIYDQLEEGGYFINADQASSRSSLFNQQYEQQWEEAVLASGLPQSALDASKERKREDRNAPMEEQLLWLREAGFKDVDCVYKYNEFTVFVARK
ncbi:MULTISPECIES: class I SAM-dependent methyltransferase [unclassified Paenibacillus]|uniref:class I SAM-dependent methyltransferase n=1 Tax=unclassified Paenibacillus TaxID=185978 RepID=UPI002F428B2D